ncbi:MAG TPA: hypothetical protein VK524_26910 [Polyangiaceae bacterium]|nr:hypothetical protein [Polyangiaceae bacterium]
MNHALRVWEESLYVAYFIRVLGRDSQAVPLDIMREALAGNDMPFELGLDTGSEREWLTLELRSRSRRSVARIRRISVTDPHSSLELAGLLDELSDEKPESAVAWLREYLSGVRVVYELEVLRCIDELSGWSPLHVVQGAIWEWAGGILHSDGEGFTNENGYFILWRFHDDAHGPGNMAVLEDGDWIEFEMDLGNPAQRAAFLEGRVPDGAQEGALSSP